MYDSENLFAKILRGEIPNDTVYEDDHVLAFRDINPQAPVHILVIPKGAYVDMDDFTANASNEEIAGFTRGVGIAARKLDLDSNGYRAIANIGTDANTEVPHLHVHVLGGGNLGPLLAR
ncbi:MAG: HIT domain-containing protein [Rhodospirillales bacterium]|nr:HIT domain-containing protein [Rhodospirillales bacterium]